MQNMVDKQQRNAHVFKAYDIGNPGSVYVPSRMERGQSRLEDASDENVVPEKPESRFEPPAKVQLKTEQRDSVGIRDDDSILLNTPPSAAGKEQTQKFQIVQPINLTFNVNQANQGIPVINLSLIHI